MPMWLNFDDRQTKNVYFERRLFIYWLENTNSWSVVQCNFRIGEFNFIPI